MSNKSELQANNTDLAALLNTINQLPVHEDLSYEISEQEQIISQLKETGNVVKPEGGILNDCSWENISAVAATGRAPEYWSIGDCKKVVLNGQVGQLNFDNFETYVYILGFNMIAGKEGSIIFGTFKSALEGGVDICLHDSVTGNKTDGTINFSLYHWGGYPYGGWKGCDLRYDVLGSTDVAPSGYGAQATSPRAGYDATPTCATNPVPNTLMAALPADLRAVMKPMTIHVSNNYYTGNSYTGYSTEYLPLMGIQEFAYSTSTVLYYGYDVGNYINNHLGFYNYYLNKSTVKYSHADMTKTVPYWTRDQYIDYYVYNSSNMKRDYSALFITATTTDVTLSNVNATYGSQGISPIFRV